MTMIDVLEPRRMLAASLLRVSSVTADNRGEILVQFSERAKGVKGSAFQVYTAGADGKLYTSDDQRQTVGFTYSRSKKLLRIVADIPKDTPYRLKLDGKTRIKNEATGALLDGDFVSASRASGDGVAGGNYEMQVQRDTSTTPEVKMRTSLGDITVRVRKDVAPISANAFLSLVNQKKYDRLLVMRLSAGFVVQLGSVQVTGDGNDPTDIVENIDAPEFGEETPRVLSNTRGTLSFARGGTGRLGSNQFFFNLGANGNDGSGTNLDTASGTGSTGVIFTPFAEVTSSKGFATLDAIAAKSPFNLTGAIDLDPATVDNSNSKTGVDEVPINDINKVTDGTFRPTRDGIIFERTAVLSKVVAKNA